MCPICYNYCPKQRWLPHLHFLLLYKMLTRTWSLTLWLLSCHGDNDAVSLPGQRSGVTAGQSQEKRQGLGLCHPIESFPSSRLSTAGGGEVTPAHTHTRSTHTLSQLEADPRCSANL